MRKTLNQMSSPNILRGLIFLSGPNLKYIFFAAVFAIVAMGLEYEKFKRTDWSRLIYLSNSSPTTKGKIIVNNDFFYYEFLYTVPGLDKPLLGYSYDYWNKEEIYFGEEITVLYNHERPTISKIKGMEATEQFIFIFIWGPAWLIFLGFLIAHFYQRGKIYKLLGDFNLRLSILCYKKNRIKSGDVKLMYKYLNYDNQIQDYEINVLDDSELSDDLMEILIVHPHKNDHELILLDSLPKQIKKFIYEEYKDVIRALFADDNYIDTLAPYSYHGKHGKAASTKNFYL
ncbi:hypothetical protein [Aureibacter tunicatorum]|uniref:DUF3592 domain-containing protein n=1 Tax=Aureibacter tunicatorum TaxID=866807 RepID=A0AAE4BUG6_9BACT|nr:hypothetical protein [Aureibacter tunicatorum]MDR6240748.1 hypothetical protein [Aureibacter tunicatorum]BDD06919.1 hypothetical protein AUTU_44020 [Aureibacter tunicatorum]